MATEPIRTPEIPYPFPPGREPPRRVEPAMVPVVDIPAGGPLDHLFDRRIILVNGALDSAASTALCASLLALDRRSADDVEVVVSSPGGPLEELAAVLDVLQLMRARTNTTCTGIARGTAAALVACGTGNRRAAPNARLTLRLEHEQAAAGSADDVRRRAAELAIRRDQLTDALTRATGQSADVITAELDAGDWHDATAARRLGLVDEVVEPRPRLIAR